MQAQTILKYSNAVPRYTSYPTAPHFHAGIGADTYAGWLGAIAADARLSLYLHIPFCDRLCWFCGCHTKQTKRYEPLTAYLEALHAEIDIVAGLAKGRGVVSAVHFGGGSPTMLNSADMAAVKAHLSGAFKFAPDAQISVEIDPNDMDDDRYRGLEAIGLTRASLGVQDFDEKVQQAINRQQGFEETRRVVERLRAMDVRSVNIDMLYGLPFQTLESIGVTARQVVSMRPDRIALFGYAHVPWMKKHQTMIDEKALPGAAERFEQAGRAGAILVDAGYVPIGIDHFALPGDSLAIALREGRLRRNFQGYTDDNADALIGFGASAIGQLPQGQVQNMPATGEYERLALSGKLATVRGVELSADDRLRGYVIERLMCEFAFSRTDLLKRFGNQASGVLQVAEDVVAEGELLIRNGDSYDVIAGMRPFARQAAAKFDAYLNKGQARHSAAI